MPPDNETALLREYASEKSDASFARLVACHIDMVYGCAMRRTGDASLAEEISQTVFTILARKAHRLNGGSGLAGWLHKTTLYESTKALRGESRRRRKMKALAAQSENHPFQNESSREILGIVDEGMDELSDEDRRVILLHYFESRSFKEIATTIGKSAAATQKQTSRALEKLGVILKRRGVTATLATLGSVLAMESAKAAPVGMASTLSAGALAGASSLTTSTLLTNAIQTMTYAKTKIALLVAGVAAIPIGMQVNSIANLEKNLQAYEMREAEFAEREKRLTDIEGKLAALPAGLMLRETLGRAGQDSARKEATAQGESLAGMPVPPFGSLAEMLKDPGTRTMVVKQMETQISETYDEFLDYLGLEEPKRSEVRTALLDRQLALASIGMEGLENHNGRMELSDSAHATATKEEHDASIRDLIGAEHYEEFDRFEKSTTERQELDTFRRMLEEQGQELPFETAQKLMAIMYEERTTNVPSNNGTEGWTPEARTAYLENLQDLQSRIRNRASEVLTSEQLDVFQNNQASRLKLIQTGIDIQSKIFPKRQ